MSHVLSSESAHHCGTESTHHVLSGAGTINLSTDKSSILVGEKFQFIVTSTDLETPSVAIDEIFPGVRLSVATVSLDGVGAGSVAYVSGILPANPALISSLDIGPDFQFIGHSPGADDSNVVHMVITDPGLFHCDGGFISWVNAAAGISATGTLTGSAAFLSGGLGVTSAGYTDTGSSLLVWQVPRDSFGVWHDTSGAWQMDGLGLLYVKHDDSYGIHCPRGLYDKTGDLGFYPGAPATLTLLP